VLKYYKS